MKWMMDKTEETLDSVHIPYIPVTIA